LSGYCAAVLASPPVRGDGAELPLALFRVSLFRSVAVLPNFGVTVRMTSALKVCSTDLRVGPYGTAFLTDTIIKARNLNWVAESKVTEAGL
jgi:hypothetical protein